MYQSYNINLKANDNIFNIIDGWMEKYQTSSKREANSSKVLSISLNPNDSLLSQIKSDNFIAELKDWATENNGIVFVTALSIYVFANPLLTLNSPIISLRDYKTGNISFLSSDENYLSDIDELFEVTSGVYYANEKKTESIFVTEEKTANKDEASSSIPGSFWLESLAMRSSIDQIIDEYMISKNKPIDNLAKEQKVSSEQVAKPKVLSKQPASSYSEVSLIAGGNGEISIPASVKQTGVCTNYTNYGHFYGKWTKGTEQRAISEQWGAANKPSSNGIATLNDRYLVALSPKFGRVGDNVDIELSNGEVIKATIADSKGRDATSEWGHVLSNGVDIIEWESAGPKSNIDLGSWKGATVDKIVNLGDKTSSQPEPEPETNSPEETKIENLEEPKDLNQGELEAENLEEREAVNSEEQELLGDEVLESDVKEQVLSLKK